MSIAILAFSCNEDTHTLEDIIPEDNTQDKECEADQIMCTSEGLFKTCQADGTWGEAEECLGDMVCNSDTNQCEKTNLDECTEAQTKCNTSTAVVYACEYDLESHVWKWSEEGNTCDGVSCNSTNTDCGVCLNDDTRCEENVSHKCENGEWSKIEDCEFGCNQAQKRCMSEAESKRECNEGEQICTDDGLKKCGSDGLWSEPYACLYNSLCHIDDCKDTVTTCVVSDVSCLDGIFQCGSANNADILTASINDIYYTFVNGDNKWNGDEKIMCKFNLSAMKSLLDWLFINWNSRIENKIKVTTNGCTLQKALDNDDYCLTCTDETEYCFKGSETYNDICDNQDALNKQMIFLGGKYEIYIDDNTEPTETTIGDLLDFTITQKFKITCDTNGNMASLDLI